MTAIRRAGASIAICTHREPDGLIDTLGSLEKEIEAGDDLLVVFNGREPTLEPLGRSEGWPVEPRPFWEPERGIARARNRALLEARYPILLFIDDDVIVQPGWRKAMADALHPSAVGAVGGTIVLRWPDSPPRWLHPRLRVLYGERRAGPDAGHRPFAANFGVKTQVAKAVGGFRIELGHRGSGMGFHEETELCDRIAQAGYMVEECVDSVVHHPVREVQARPAYLLRRGWAEGRSDALRDVVRGQTHSFMRAMKLGGLLLWLPLSVIWPDRFVFGSVRIANNLAYLTERLKHGTTRKRSVGTA